MRFTAQERRACPAAASMRGEMATDPDRRPRERQRYLQVPQKSVPMIRLKEGNSVLTHPRRTYVGVGRGRFLRGRRLWKWTNRSASDSRIER